MERGKNKVEWQELSTSRLKDAEVLFENERYGAAYYLAGYAVECAFKARIASFVREGDFPANPPYVREYLYTHDLANLLKAAELSTIFEEKSKSDPSFKAHWETVRAWTEGSRYDNREESAAADMLASAKGVVKWLREYW